MRRVARFRPFLLAAAAGAALLAAGCEDQRQADVGTNPGFLDGDGLFGVSVVTTAILAYQNELAERLLDVVENNLSTPIFENGCIGNGQRGITRDPRNPRRFRVQHGVTAGSAYTINCAEAFRLTLNGVVFIEFLETSPGLHYRVEMPLNQQTGLTEGMVYTLPQEFGSAILEVTTPGVTFNPEIDPYGANGFLDCRLEPSGSMAQIGTVRFEDRVGGLLIVAEMDLDYDFDRALRPRYSRWPAGSYELGAVAPAGGFGPGGSVTSVPVDVFFDGFGGASFRIGDRLCVTNLATGENPCEDL
jgi:hypothetical protein